MTFIGHNKLGGIDLPSRADVAAAVVVGSVFTTPSGEDGKEVVRADTGALQQLTFEKRRGFFGGGGFNWVVVMSVDGA